MRAMASEDGLKNMIEGLVIILVCLPQSTGGYILGGFFYM